MLTWITLARTTIGRPFASLLTESSPVALEGSFKLHIVARLRQMRDGDSTIASMMKQVVRRYDSLHVCLSAGSSAQQLHAKLVFACANLYTYTPSCMPHLSSMHTPAFSTGLHTFCGFLARATPCAF